MTDEKKENFITIYDETWDLLPKLLPFTKEQLVACDKELREILKKISNDPDISQDNKDKN